MISGFSSFVLSFCTVCVFLGGIFCLCPKGSFEKPVKYIFCLVFLCYILSVTVGIKEIKADFPEYNASYTASAQTAEVCARQIFGKALKDNGIEFSKITVCTDKSENDSIIITKVIIYTCASCETVKKIIPDTENYVVEVINE